MFIGEIHTSVIGSFAADQHFGDNVVTLDLFHPENHKSVVKKNFIALFHNLGNMVVSYRNAGFVA